jgi:hypothetical protein
MRLLSAVRMQELQNYKITLLQPPSKLKGHDLWGKLKLIWRHVAP